MNVHKTWSKYHAIWGHPIHILHHWHNLHGGCAISWNGIHTIFICVYVCVCVCVSVLMSPMHGAIHLSIHSTIYLFFHLCTKLTLPTPIHSSIHLCFYLIPLSEICDHPIFVLVIKQFLPLYINPLSAVRGCFFTGW
jgi:hypothetical protein